MYCDLVHRTNQTLPYDYKDKSPTGRRSRRRKKSVDSDVDEEEKHPPYCQKFKSFVCCLKPKADTAVKSKTLMLDVIRLPSQIVSKKKTRNGEVPMFESGESNQKPVAFNNP